MLSGRRYRLELTAEQAQMCQEFGDICRAVWNTALEQRREYRRRGAWMNYVPQAAQLAEAKREHPWLKVAPSHVLQQTLRDLDRACREHGTFRVRWRSKARWPVSFRFPAGNLIKVERLSRKWARAKFPKLGWVRFRWSRPLGGEVRSATVARRGGQWFVSFLVEDGHRTPEKHTMPDTAVGIDRGVAVAAVTSDGTFHDRKFIAPGEAARYRRLQHKLARQEKGSANRSKTIAAMGRIMWRVTDRRADFCAYTANRVTTLNALVVLEDLRTRKMAASASGTLERPGSKVRQKAGLNRAILDKGWYRLEVALRSAARYTGSWILLVDPAYTSQRCNRCGHVDAKSRKSQAVFACTACGHRDHADVNAAKNHRDAGLAFPACGDLGTSRSAKQEPVSRATGRNP
ncbi:transposase, OrfB [Streptomyces himastatinicus ATCC 53653]|uniref:Transposase, OrfB n=1 Tax=Streptomyces himastatinicus ATCC 53653 TaxID=457427 RepID=D9WI92_9ACTN|nr:RNA-guided endonuclease TnpB family protein [Streptomyces himastatinicus]EFL23475.1 transposase, OrfB [Streptomyces himastatinicus ATCC 53653]